MPFTYLPAASIEQGITRKDAAFLLSIIGGYLDYFGEFFPQFGEFHLKHAENFSDSIPWLATKFCKQFTNTKVNELNVSW